MSYLKIDGDKLISTDGFRLVKTDNPLSVRAGYIHYNDIDKVKKNPDGAKNYIDKKVNYPDLEKIATKYRNHFKIECADLKIACRMASFYYRDSNKITRQFPTIKIKLDDKNLIVFIKENLIKTKVKIPVIKSTQRYFRMTLNPMLLFDILPNKGIITVKFNDGN